MSVELWIVRHAKAEARGPAWSDDRARPLTAAGERQAARLAEAGRELGVQLDRLFSSPLIRAAQTAEPLRALLRPGRSVEYLDALAREDPLALLEELREHLEPGDGTLACVGHEPSVSIAASYLLAGPGRGLAFAFKKSAALLLEGELAPAGMTLRAFLPPLLLRARP